jgi:hypothetical protein
MINEDNLVIVFATAAKMMEYSVEHDLQKYIKNYCKLFAATLGLARPLSYRLGIDNFCNSLISYTTPSQDSMLMDIVWSYVYKDQIFDKLDELKDYTDIKLNDSSLDIIKNVFNPEPQPEPVLTLEHHIHKLVKTNGLPMVLAAISKEMEKC